MDWFRDLMLLKTGGDALRLVDTDEVGLERLKKWLAESVMRKLCNDQELSEAESKLSGQRTNEC